MACKAIIDRAIRRHLHRVAAQGWRTRGIVRARSSENGPWDDETNERQAHSDPRFIKRAPTRESGAQLYSDDQDTSRFRLSRPDNLPLEPL